MRFDGPSISSPLSAAVSKVRIFRDDMHLGPATGFFYRSRNRIFLITNRHVVTLRDNETGESLHDMKAEPNRIECQVVTRKSNSDGILCYYAGDFNASLLNQDGTPRWLEHPKHKGKVDVVAIFVGIDDDRLGCAINDIDLVDLQPRPGTEALIVGFPFGSTYRSDLPLWKHGIIATEPSFDFDGQPRFLIDSVTHRGMSGSPVFVRMQFGRWTKGKDEAKRQVLGEGIDFAGVYSGRLRWPHEGHARELSIEEKLFQMQVGVVWRADVVEEIVSQQTLL